VSSYRIKLENETQKVLSKWQKVERDAEDTMSPGKLFQIFGAATGNALLATVCDRGHRQATNAEQQTHYCLHAQELYSAVADINAQSCLTGIVKERVIIPTLECHIRVCRGVFYA